MNGLFTNYSVTDSYNLWSRNSLITTSCMARKTYKIPYKKSLNFVFKRPEKW